MNSYRDILVSAFKLIRKETKSIVNISVTMLISIIVPGIGVFLILKFLDLSSLGAILLGNLIGLVLQTPLDKGHLINSNPIVGKLSYEEGCNFYYSTLRHKFKTSLVSALPIFVCLYFFPIRDHKELFLLSMLTTVLLIFSSDQFFLLKRRYRIYFASHIAPRALLGTLGLFSIPLTNSAITYLLTNLAFALLNLSMGINHLRRNMSMSLVSIQAEQNKLNSVMRFRLADDFMTLIPGIALGLFFPAVQYSFSAIERLLRLMALFPSVLQSGMMPWVFEKQNKDDKRDLRLIQVLNMIALLLSILLVFTLPTIIDFYSSGKVIISAKIGIVCAVYVFNLISTRAILVLYALPKFDTNWLPLTTLVAGLFTLITTILFGSLYGFTGSIFAVSMMHTFYNSTLYFEYFKRNKYLTF